MEVKIVWTEFAITQLDQIFDFYKYNVNSDIAKRIVLQILDYTILLKKNHSLKPRELLLIDIDKEYKYLVVGKYKIIFYIEENHIKISSVFDCRLNPEKMK